MMTLTPGRLRYCTAVATRYHEQPPAVIQYTRVKCFPQTPKVAPSDGPIRSHAWGGKTLIEVANAWPHASQDHV